MSGGAIKYFGFLKQEPTCTHDLRYKPLFQIWLQSIFYLTPYLKYCSARVERDEA